MMTHEEIEAAIERLRELGCYGRITTSDIIDAVFEDGNNYKVHDTLIDLLKQADPDTHMELPKGSDGMPIHIGDELVTNHSKKKFVVTRLKYSKKHKWMIGGADRDDLSEYGLYAPYETRHYHKPTVEDVLVAYYKECQLHASELGFVTDEGKEKAWRDIATAFADKLREMMADEAVGHAGRYSDNFYDGCAEESEGESCSCG